jgi:hypothetical protein
VAASSVVSQESAVRRPLLEKREKWRTPFYVSANFGNTRCARQSEMLATRLALPAEERTALANTLLDTPENASEFISV